MKRKFLALLTAAIVAATPITAFALDYYVPENAQEVTARFTVTEPGDGEVFVMASEDGEVSIIIDEDTLIYFEEAIPVDDDSEETSQMVRDLLFGRTVAEVLEGRNMRVILDEDGQVVSIKVLFETIAFGPAEVSPEEVAAALAAATDEDAEAPDVEEGLLIVDMEDEEEGYVSIVPLPIAIGDIEVEAIDETVDADIDADLEIELNGEVVINDEVLADHPAPFVYDNTIMLPLRAIAEALGYDVTWNGELQSVMMGVGINLWIGQTEVHRGRMAPLEISAPPVIIDGVTFVPMDFFRTVVGLDAFWFEGQVVVAESSDMY